MFQRQMGHWHNRQHGTEVAGLVPWWTVRNNHDDDPDGAGGKGGSGGAGGDMVSMSQRAFNALLADEKAKAKRSAEAALTERYGDLEALKAKADEADGLKTKVTELETKVTDLEAEKASQAAQALRDKVAADFGLKPEAAAFLTGDDEDALKEKAKELATLMGVKVPEPGAEPKEGDKPPAQPAGGGTNPAGGGAPEPKGLSEAISAHYKGA